MATMLGSLLVSLGLESGQFKSGLSAAEKDLKKTTRSIERMGRKIGDLGKNMTVGLTAPLVLLGKKSVEGFVAQEQAMADVEAALKSMGDASGKTGKELLKTADALELNSLFDADIILKQVTANLLTFGNVAGKQFDRAQQAAVDMAERLGTEPRSAAIMLGKALNAPTQGISALTRVGVQFTEQQKDQIKAMEAAGDIAGAQGIILAEVEKQFKGAAAAASDATPWRKAQVAIGQAMDTIGGAILPIIGPVAEAIASIASAFASLPEPIQKVAVVAGVMAAALGPVLMVVGPLVSAMAPFLATLKAIAATQGLMVALGSGLTGLAAAFGPVLLAVGAVYLAWKNWDEFAPHLQPLIDQLTAIGEGLGLVEMKAGQTNSEIAKDESYRNFGRKLVEINNALQRAADGFDAFNARNRVWVLELRAKIAEVLSDVMSWGRDIAAQMLEIGGNMVDGLVRGIKAAPGRVKDALVGMASGAVTAAKNFLGIKSPSRVFMEIGEFITKGLAIGIAKGNEAEKAMVSMLDGILQKAFPAVYALRELNDEIAALNKGVASGLISADLAASASDNLREQYRSDTYGESRVTTDQGPLVQEDKLQKAGDAVARSLGLLADKSKMQTVRIAKSFKDMAQESLQALQGMVSAIKGGGFLDILGSAINLFLQLGSTGLFGKGIAANINKPSVPGYATGTNFHPGGLAMVGERGPELVSMPRGSKVFTNRETSGMMGGSSHVTITMDPSTGMLGAFVRNQSGQVVAQAAPSLMNGGAQVAASRMSRKQTRQVA